MINCPINRRLLCRHQSRTRIDDAWFIHFLRRQSVAMLTWTRETKQAVVLGMTHLARTALCRRSPGGATQQYLSAFWLSDPIWQKNYSTISVTILIYAESFNTIAVDVSLLTDMHTLQKTTPSRLQRNKIKITSQFAPKRWSFSHYGKPSENLLQQRDQ